MGFYGKIYEQATNIFNRLRFKNTNLNNCAGPSTFSPESEFTIQADGGEAAAVFNAGNKWIQFENNYDNHLQCDIYHKLSQVIHKDKEEDIIETIKVIPDAENIYIEDGDIITLNTVLQVQLPIVDTAGHIVRYEIKYFRMLTDLSELLNDINTALETAHNANETANKAERSANQAVIDASTAAASAQNAVEQARQAKNAAQESAELAQQSANEVSEVSDQINNFDSTLKSFGTRLTLIEAYLKLE